MIPFMDREGPRFPLLKQVITAVRNDMLELASKKKKKSGVYHVSKDRNCPLVVETVPQNRV